MTKSTKHKKIRKEELNKIKLKVGKKLKKSQNETKTDFKTRKIILKEQLPDKSNNSLLTKKHHSVKELLSQLKHHSVYVRQDGLNGLKELILKSAKHELAPYLSMMLKELNPCMLDTDHLIRTTAIKLIEAIIMKVGSIIHPYFRLLVSHLSCAMVHLNTGVQSDSLQLMEVLLSHAPSLIAQSANLILENFFLLISRKLDGQRKEAELVKSNYTLIANPSSQLASIKWRIKLLKSLGKYLEAILAEINKLEAAVPRSLWQVISIGSLPPLIKYENNKTNIHGTKILIEESETKQFIQTLIPLLFQAWAEINFGNSHEKLQSGTPFDAITINLLSCISRIILHLWKITEIATQQNPSQCNWFMYLLKKHFKAEILEGFPYCPLEGTGKASINKKKKSSNDLEAECDSVNINLASLSFLYLNHDKKIKKNIARYYIELLSSGNRTNDNRLDIIVSTATHLLKDDSGLSVKIRRDLLSASLKCYQQEISSPSRSSLIKMPLQASDYACKHLWGSVSLTEWMKELVQNAAENIQDENVLESLLQFKLRNTQGFSRILAVNKELLQNKMAFEAKTNRKLQIDVVL